VSSSPPDDAHYQPIEFERAEQPHQVDAVIASTSLHHVADPAVRAKLPLDFVDRSSAGRSGRRSAVGSGTEPGKGKSRGIVLSPPCRATTGAT